MLKKERLTVEGMSCKHCVESVKRAVSQLNGVQDVQVDLAHKQVDVQFDDDTATVSDIKAAIEDQGYEVAD